MADKVQPAPAAPPRDLTSGFYAEQGIETNGFTSPGDSIQGSLNGTGTAIPADTSSGPVRITAADRATRRNRVGEEDKTMFNQLGRFDEKPSSAAQGTLANNEAVQKEPKSVQNSFTGMKYS